MTRNLKILGALVSVLAMTAIVASSASANKAYWFTTDNTTDWTVLTGEQTAAFSDEFRVDGSAALGEGVTKCEKTTYTGSLGVTTTSTITLEATYDGCKLEPFGSAEVHMNGCKYEFHADGQTTNAKGEPNGEFDTTTTIVCPPEKDITITAKVAGVTKCVIHVEPGDIGTGIVLTNEAGPPKDLKAHIHFVNLKYTQTTGEGAAHCDATSTTNNGVYNGTATIKGKNTAGVGVNIDVG